LHSRHLHQYTSFSYFFSNSANNLAGDANNWATDSTNGVESKHKSVEPGDDTMLKKVAIGTFAVAAVGTLIFGRDACSYLTTGVTSVRDSIRCEVPVEFEIERARQQVAQLLPEVRKSLHHVAEEEVAVANLKKSIDAKLASLEGQEEAILELTADLKSGDEQFVYAGHNYTVSEVQRDLTERFNRFTIAEETVKQEQELLNARERTLVTLRSTLSEMLSQKKTLEVEIERLEARVQTIAARKQINGIEVDDSHLTRTKALISSIEKRLDVEDAVLAAEGDFAGLIPVEVETDVIDTNITDRIEARFGTGIVTEIAAK